MREVKRDIVSALIFSKDGKLFQGKKDPKQGGVYSHCWHLPGGGIEVGENKDVALAREVLEETGIDVTPYEHILVDDVGTGIAQKRDPSTNDMYQCSMRFYVYRIDIVDQIAEDIQVALNDDLVEYRWFNITDIEPSELTPPSATLFSRLGLL